MIAIAIAQRQARLAPDDRRQRKAIREILRDVGHARAAISLTLVDDEEIHALNRQFLGHDYPTDVITFQLSAEGEPLEGEIVVSVDTAAATAERLGWDAADELLLYVIHGALHLAGYDDTSERAAAKMRRAEREYLGRFGLEPPPEKPQPAKLKRAKPRRRTALAAGKRGR